MLQLRLNTKIGPESCLLCNGLSPHKWSSTLKSAVFGSMPSLPHLLDTICTLLCSHEGKANLLNGRFESKQCRIAMYSVAKYLPS
jgi:hypothetical protein